ncbi:MAG: aconitase/3-isopropylmalate dehydratase large subunit family protein [Candidatus Zixiibacteriota bacterium]
MPRRKIPTKAELIRLQKLYKTDEKIAERLGNVTPQLIAYWRRKKNIARHSFPKFSIEEIRDIWERYGDDYRCGLELGISKAAFYNWRRKYNLKEKPAFLKLEQLELNLGIAQKSATANRSFDRRTVVQKILARSTGQDKVEPDEIIEVEPDLAVLYTGTAEIIRDFQKLGRNYLWNPNRVVIALNNCSPQDMNKSAEDHKLIREFVKLQNIKYFYDLYDGVCHQNVVESGMILPGQLAFGTARSISSYGCIGAFASEVSPETMTSLWVDGKVETRVPHTVKIIVNGKLPESIYIKDLALFITNKLNSENIEGKAIEFYGTTISQMSISERFSLTNAAVEMGALTAVCSFDSVSRKYLLHRIRMPFRPALADKNAEYAQTYEFNIEQLIPQIACPGSLGNVRAVSELDGVRVDQIIIGTCASGRLDDLKIASDILKGKRIDSGVRVLISPASKSVYLEALKKGLIRSFLEAGAVVLGPGCGSCVGGGVGALAAGEKCLTTGNCNTQGRLGSLDSEIYIVSPATAAASAIKGVITNPTGYIK